MNFVQIEINFINQTLNNDVEAKEKIISLLTSIPELETEIEKHSGTLSSLQYETDPSVETIRRVHTNFIKYNEEVIEASEVKIEELEKRLLTDDQISNLEKKLIDLKSLAHRNNYEIESFFSNFRIALSKLPVITELFYNALITNSEHLNDLKISLETTLDFISRSKNESIRDYGSEEAIEHFYVHVPVDEFNNAFNTEEPFITKKLEKIIEAGPQKEPHRFVHSFRDNVNQPSTFTKDLSYDNLQLQSFYLSSAQRCINEISIINNRIEVSKTEFESNHYKELVQALEKTAWERLITLSPQLQNDDSKLKRRLSLNEFYSFVNELQILTRRYIESNRFTGTELKKEKILEHLQSLYETKGIKTVPKFSLLSGVDKEIDKLL